jgi:hypothetical protein
MWELKPLLFCDLYGTTQIVPVTKAPAPNIFASCGRRALTQKQKSAGAEAPFILRLVRHE